MTSSEKNWLITTYRWEFYLKPFEHPYISAHYEAERILKGYQNIIPLDCNCKSKDFLKGLNKLYDEWYKDQKV